MIIVILYGILLSRVSFLYEKKKGIKVDQFHVTNISQACYFLNVSPNASDEIIKKSYREQCKLYHPDTNLNCGDIQRFLLIQESYQFLMEYKKRVMFVKEQVPKQARVFSSNSNARKQFEKQKKIAKEREYVKQWEEKKKRERIEQEKMIKKPEKEMSKEEELLQRIKAIWLAENIRRQVQEEKEKIELENKRKLYRAFMKQRLNEEDEWNHKK